MLNLGPRIHEARSAKNLSQTDLARIIGVKTAMVSLYEHNRRTPSLEIFF